MRAAIVALGLAGLPHPGVAQRVVTGTIRLAYLEHRVDVGTGVELARGPTATGEVTIRLHPRWMGVIQMTGGQLKGSSGALDRHVAEVGVAAQFTATPWLVMESGFTRRVYGTDLARQRWALLRVGGLASVPFAGDAVRGVIGAWWIPIANVPGLTLPNLRLAASAGLEYRRGRGRVSVRYGLERYDWTGTFPRRLEQLSGVTIGLALPLGKRGPPEAIAP